MAKKKVNLKALDEKITGKSKSKKRKSSEKKSPERKELEKAWQKEYKRIRKFERAAEKRGFTFSDKVEKQLQKPKRITEASVRKLRKLTPKELYEKATYKTSGGEIVSGRRGRWLERKAAHEKSEKTQALNRARKKYYDDNEFPWVKGKKGKDETGDTPFPPSFSDIVLNNIIEELRRWSPLPTWSDWFAGVKNGDKDTLWSLLNGALMMDGKDAVAQRLEDNAEEVNRIVAEVCYGSDRDAINLDLVRFSAIVKGRPLSERESADLTDEVEDLNYE